MSFALEQQWYGFDPQIAVIACGVRVIAALNTVDNVCRIYEELNIPLTAVHCKNTDQCPKLGPRHCLRSLAPLGTLRGIRSFFRGVTRTDSMALSGRWESGVTGEGSFSFETRRRDSGRGSWQGGGTEGRGLGVRGI